MFVVSPLHFSPTTSERTKQLLTWLGLFINLNKFWLFRIKTSIAMRFVHFSFELSCVVSRWRPHLTYRNWGYVFVLTFQIAHTISWLYDWRYECKFCSTNPFGFCGFQNQSSHFKIIYFHQRNTWLFPIKRRHLFRLNSADKCAKRNKRRIDWFSLFEIWSFIHIIWRNIYTVIWDIK